MSEREAGGVRLTGIYRYPVKSCRGVAVPEAEVDRRGLAGDREFMVVDTAGRFLTQRELARLALIAPRRAEATLTLTAPRIGPLTIEPTDTGPAREVTVWRDVCDAVDQGDEAADWLGSFLNVPCRLVRLAPAFRRGLDPTFVSWSGGEVGFADGFPFLIVAEESLAELNRRLPEPLPMNRFRPNLVVAGCPAFAEDGWLRIRVGEVELSIVKPCARCAITTTDQASAVRGKEPLRTLAGFRNVPGRGVMFAQNAVHRNTGRLRLGDTVEVLDVGRAVDWAFVPEPDGAPGRR